MIYIFFDRISVKSDRNHVTLCLSRHASAVRAFHVQYIYLHVSSLVISTYHACIRMEYLSFVPMS